MSCNLTFNPNNEYHLEAAGYLDIIPARRKTAFFVHLIDHYKSSHPYGPDWAEIEKIMKFSKSTYSPKHPIQQNLAKDTISAETHVRQNVNSVSMPENSTENIHHAIDRDILEDLKILGIE